MKRWRVAAVALAALIAVATGAVWQFRKHASGPRPIAPEARAPDGVRVRVQVMNGTKTRGLARRATMLLRDRGFDVLETGTVRDARDTTIVYDLTGHPDWAQRVARVFSPARVERQIDSSRYLDVAVVLGSAWRPPAEPFYP